MVWFYVALFGIVVTGGFLSRRLLKDSPGTLWLVIAWSCLLLVVFTFLIFAVEGDHSLLILAMGTINTSFLALLVYSRRITS